jgi:hypothetical protein
MSILFAIIFLVVIFKCVGLVLGVCGKHPAAMHNSTNANAVEIPNTIAPTAMDKINPNKLSTAPRSFPHTPSTRPTHLKITTRNMIANKIDMISPPVKQNLEDFFGLLYSHCQHL